MGDPLPPGAERNVFGANSTYHDVTGMPLENGIGALPHEHQAQLHCNVIEQQQGKAAGDAMRAKLEAAKAPKRPGNITPQHLQIVEKTEGKEAAAAQIAANNAAKED